MTEQQKLRYPNRREIDSCFEHLISEYIQMSPQIVFLLGEKVYSSVGKHLKIEFEKWDEFEYHYKEYKGTYYVPIHHPSYIYVYKRKRMERIYRRCGKIIRQLTIRNRYVPSYNHNTKNSGGLSWTKWQGI